jgi:PTS system galactosamine-specific IIB component
MPNILLTRIDNRLVHGQVGVSWTASLGTNLILVADDIVAKDSLQQRLMKMVADGQGVDIRFFSVEKTINVIEKAAPRQKIFLICRTPKEVRRLVDGGVPLESVNVGNMHYSEGKRQISKKVYVNDEDLEDLKYLESKGIDVFIQDVPGDIKEKIS